MFTQLRTWYVITTKEKLDIKSHFLAPCSDTTEAQVATSAHQLDMYQVKCKDHGVTITNNDKVDHFAAHMYACGLFEATFMDDWEDTQLTNDQHTQFKQALYRIRGDPEWPHTESMPGSALH